MALRKIKLYGTVDASGDLTITSNVNLLGYLHQVRWIDGDLDDGIDAVLSVDSADGASPDITLLTLTNANDDAIYFPRELEDDNAGSALVTYTWPVVDGALKLVISDGGNAKSGGCIAYVEV